MLAIFANDSGGASGQAVPYNNANEGLNLLHVVSPFKVDDCSWQFCPFDQAQSVTIGSMIRARNKVEKGSVTLAAAVFEDELPHLPLPGFQVLPAIIRSTMTLYPDLPSRPSFPFIQDILDRALTHDATADYLIYTNSDIILHEDFYNIVQSLIAEHDYDYFTINRRLVSTTRSDGELRTVADLDEIFTSDFQEHPGSDCFVIKRELAMKINMGDVFIGAPFFANTLNLKALYHSRNPGIFKSGELRATFHLGDDRRWLNRRMSLYSFQNAMNSVCQDSWLQSLCADLDSSEFGRGMRVHCKRLESKMQRYVDDKFQFQDNGNFCHRQDIYNKSLSRAKLVFSMGVEGSGHHFLAAVESKSGIALLADHDESFKLLREKQKHAAHTLRSIYHLTDLHIDPDALDLGPVYREFVDTLRSIQQIVQNQIAANQVVDGVIPVHLNVIDGVMTSFPGTDSPARYAQLPDLGIFYRACEDAEVDCGHILMTRDAHEVVRSTTRHRSFDHPKRQIVNLAMQLNLLIAQAIQYPHKLVGCFDYNNPASLLQNRGTEEWLGSSFKSAILSNYAPSANLTIAERLELVPEGFGLYMDSMIRATDMLRTTCKNQLGEGPRQPVFTQMSHWRGATNGARHLLPPFKIVQIGEPRSGSTFQYELLRAILTIKSPPGTKIESRFVSRNDWYTDPFRGVMGLASNSTFIIKTHTSDARLRKAGNDASVAVFSSSEIVPYSLYTQKRANLERCSECELDKYRPFFNLTDDDILILKQHMRDFTILRQW